MQLLCSTTSPFARKVRMFAIDKGVDHRVELVTANPLDDPGDLLAVNPLSKIPALITDDGTALYDSGVICAYLDSLTDAPVLIPPHGAERWIALRGQALADGVMEAGVALVFEARRESAQQSPHWQARWRDKIDRALATLDAGPQPPVERIDGIATAAMLGYLDFRLPDLDWRHDRPALTAWWQQAAQRAAYRDTAPPAA